MTRFALGLSVAALLSAGAGRLLAQEDLVIRDPNTGKAVMDLRPMLEQAARLEAEGRAEEAARVRMAVDMIRAKIREKLAAQQAAEAQRAAERQAMLAQMRAQLADLQNLAAALEQQGEHEKAAQVRARIEDQQRKMAAILAEASGPPRIPGLKLAASAPAKITVGQPVRITAVITNTSRRAVKLAALAPDCLADNANPRLSFIVWHEDRKPVRRRRVPTTRPDDSADSPATQPDERKSDAKPAEDSRPKPVAVTLKPGGRLTLSDSEFFPMLSELYAFDRPGRFIFQVAYRFAAPDGRVADLITDPLKLTVVAPPDKLPDRPPASPSGDRP